MSVLNIVSINGTEYDIQDANAVAFNESQDLTSAEKAQARTNIGAGEPVTIDATLAIAGAAADAKKTGDELSGVKSQIGVLEPLATSSDVGKALIVKTVSGGKVTEYEFGEAGGSIDPEEIAEAVDAWLDEHPEAVTTVEDWSLTENKLVKGALGFVTPEMFGAVGDGETDDTDAIKSALEYAIGHGCELRFAEKTYIVTPKYQARDYIEYPSGTYFSFLINANESVVIDLNNATLKIGLNDKNAITIFYGYFADSVIIKNGTLIGDRYNESYGTGSYYDSSKLITMFDCTNIHIENVTMKESKGDGIGFDGIENGQSSSIPFRDVYANNTMRDCIMEDCQRDGITIVKGRGMFFSNCLMRDLGPLSPGAGVDIEPYYGNGSVFDLTFDNCFARNAIGGGFFVQNCDNVIVTNCDLQSLMAREAYGFRFHNNNLGDLSVKSGTGVIDGNTIAETITYQPRNNAVIPDGQKELHILNNRIYGGLQLYYADTNPLVLDVVEITGNYIERNTRHVVDVGETNKTINFKNIVLKNNTLKTYGNSSSYQIINLKNLERAEVYGNTMIADRQSVTGASVAIKNVSGIVLLSNNTLQFERSIYDTYTDFYPLFLKLESCNGLRAMIKDNTVNLDAYVGYVIDKDFIAYTDLTNSKLFITGNYANKFLKIIEPTNQVIVSENNILNDQPSYQSASGVNF